MKKIVLSVAVIAVFLAPVLAFAQEETEVGKLKERLMALEQKLYSGQTASTAVDGTLMADFEARLYTLEEESQKVYGAVEELGHTVSEFAKRMDLISKDLDLRLADLEKAVETLKTAKVEVEKASEATPKSTPQPPQKKATVKDKKPKVNTSSAVPEKISAEDLYNKAYQLLVATAYDDAEAWMMAFIKRHPEHELADNAHYWLGEIYLVREMPEKAVVSFSTGLSKFPKGAKAPANLLKMGVAFKQMGKADFAESSWKKLIQDYDKTPEADKAEKELEKLKAKG